jgi:hypothetical protein
MKDLCGKETVASVAIGSKETKSGEYLKKVDEFLTEIKRSK